MHVGVIVSTVSIYIAPIVLVQYIQRQWIEHVFTLEANNYDIMCGNRHNQLPERFVPIALLRASISAQVLLIGCANKRIM